MNCISTSLNGRNCPNKEYCRLGFNLMTWTDPCKAGLADVPGESVISEGGEIAPPSPPAPPAKGAIPWWLIIVGGYLLYREGQGI